MHTKIPHRLSWKLERMMWVLLLKKNESAASVLPLYIDLAISSVLLSFRDLMKQKKGTVKLHTWINISLVISTLDLPMSLNIIHLDVRPCLAFSFRFLLFYPFVHILVDSMCHYKWECYAGQLCVCLCHNEIN